MRTKTDHRPSPALPSIGLWEVISNWLKRHTQRGLSLAAEYAKAGYDMALERADQAWSARQLLDSGAPAQEARS